ncbi:MAG: hypothetical protein KAS93_05980 [Gammaproteobacteria bacterium]|nr:hypothetical protein [Gammaproteobacteria bacterium]
MKKLFIVGLILGLMSFNVFAKEQHYVMCAQVNKGNHNCSASLNATNTQQDLEPISKKGIVIHYNILRPGLTRLACDMAWHASQKDAEKNPGTYGTPCCVKVPTKLTPKYVGINVDGYIRKCDDYSDS